MEEPSYILTRSRRSLLGFWGPAANNSSGDLHGTNVKRTKAFSPLVVGLWQRQKVKFWRPAWASKFHGLRLRRMRKVLKSVWSFLFRCSHSFVTRFFLGLVLYSILFPYFYCFFGGGKRRCSLSKRCWKELSSHLQFSITARVSMTLKRQSVRSLLDHKAARTFCLSQERGIFEQMVWSGTKRSFSLVWSRWGAAGGGGVWGYESEWDWGENQKILLKNTIETIKYDRKNKRKKKKKERKK